MHESKVDEIIEELRDYKRWLASEDRRVTRALNALSDHDDEENPSTNEMLLDAFRRVDKPMTIQEAYLHVKKAGWTTESKDPTNVIRAALARMAANGELRRISDKRGVYALVSDDPFEDPSPPKSKSALKASFDNSWPPKEDQEDPWSSPPEPKAFGGPTPGRFVRPAKPAEEDEPPF